MTCIRKMLIRTILLKSFQQRYYNVLLINSRSVLQNRQISYSLGLPVKHLYANSSFQCAPGIFYYVFHQFGFKYSHANTKIDEVQYLCDCILSEKSEDYRNEKIEHLKKVLEFLLAKGYTSKEIEENILEHLKSKDWSYLKFKTLADIDSDIILLLPLLPLPMSLLKSIANNAKTDRCNMKGFSNRIHYLSYHLELEPQEFIPILAKHLPLLTMNFKRLDMKMNILKNANISPKYIVKDLWIFNYNEQLLANRVQAALKAGVELKPWILRCSDKFFNSLLVRQSETKRILNGESLHSFLAKRLDCSIEYVDYMMERNKLLKTINVPKLDQVISFLFKKGYTPEEVRLFPRVFCSSVQSLEKRFQELQHIKSTLPTLAQLCMSSKNARALLKKGT